jgi:glutamate formiminotransferase
MFDKIIECVPNFSEGRNREVLEKIVEPFRRTDKVKLLDYSSDPSHNRAVVTVIGVPEAVKGAIVEAAGIAVKEIDLNHHEGEHPRMGAVDVVPFIPVRNVTMTDAITIAKDTAQQLAERYGLPIYLYEKAASRPERENLANIRKGEFEGFKEKINLPDWMPDFGPAVLHPTAGATVVGARAPLVAYNVNLGTGNLEIADKIAKRVRHISGGLRYVKALGVALEDRGIVQVSMNLTDYTKSSIYQAFEMVKMEARRYGVPVIGSEIVGLTPQDALIEAAAYYLGLENFSTHQILENRLME